VAKPLQIETWLLWTAYRKLLAPYQMVPPPTPTTYRLATIPHDWHTTVNPLRSSKVSNFHVI